MLALLPMIGWWTYGLFDIDEGFYASIVWEMNQRHEWVTPFFNGDPWFEKPILLYWFAKPCLMLFGPEVGLRLPSVLSTLGIFALAYWFLRRRGYPNASSLAVLILGGSILIAGLGRQMMTDAPLTLALTVAMLAFWESLAGDRRWRLLTAFCLGLAVLAKGPIALFLFVAIAGYTFWREKDLRHKFRGQWLLGTLILALTIGSWYLPAYLANGDFFVQEFLVKQNLGRFKGGDVAHHVGGLIGLVYFVPVILLALFPWSLWIPSAWPKRGSNGFERFLATWAFTIFALFTASGSKLPHYIEPALIPLGMLVAIRLQGNQKAIRWAAAWCVAVSLLFAWVAPYYYNLFHAEIHALAREVPTDHPVAVFEMSRKEGRPPIDIKTPFGNVRLNESAHPSLVLYLERRYIDTRTLQDIVSAPKPLYLLTRFNRIENAEQQTLEEQGIEIEQIQTKQPQKWYRLYRLEKIR